MFLKSVILVLTTNKWNFRITNKHTPANAFGIGPAHKEQESQRRSLVTQTSVSET